MIIAQMVKIKIYKKTITATYNSISAEFKNLVTKSKVEDKLEKLIPRNPLINLKSYKNNLRRILIK